MRINISEGFVAVGLINCIGLLMAMTFSENHLRDIAVFQGIFYAGILLLYAKKITSITEDPLFASLYTVPLAIAGVVLPLIGGLYLYLQSVI